MTTRSLKPLQLLVRGLAAIRFLSFRSHIVSLGRRHCRLVFAVCG